MHCYSIKHIFMAVSGDGDDDNDDTMTFIEKARDRR